MNQPNQSSYSPSASHVSNGSKVGIPKTLLCEMCLKIGRQTPAPSVFVCEDRTEKPTCSDHFVVLQQAELVAEFRKRKLEKMKTAVLVDALNEHDERLKSK